MSFVSRKEGHNDNLMGIRVNNEEEAYKFYKEYGIRKWFSVRKSISRYQVETKDIC